MLDRLRKSTYLSIMNKLPLSKRVQIINLLVEGSSLRAASRIADVSINTVTKLLIEVGKACEQFHNEKVCSSKQSAYSAMRFGALFTASKRTYRKAWRKRRAIYGRGRV